MFPTQVLNATTFQPCVVAHAKSWETFSSAKHVFTSCYMFNKVISFRTRCTFCGWIAVALNNSTIELGGSLHLPMSIFALSTKYFSMVNQHLNSICQLPVPVRFHILLYLCSIRHFFCIVYHILLYVTWDFFFRFFSPWLSVHYRYL
jgi:hypothetical protein